MASGKYELSTRASWRKLPIGVNKKHYFEACVLTDRFGSGEAQVEPLLEQIEQNIDHLTADGAYDKVPVYNAITAHSPDADVVIPPREDAVLSDKASPWRNLNLTEHKHWGECNGKSNVIMEREITLN
jgi:hypothetical protein